MSVALLAALTVVIGDFTYVEELDPIDDTLVAYAQLQTQGGTLSIACMHKRSKTIFVELHTDRFLAVPAHPLLAELMPFQYRVDQAEPKSAAVSYGLDTIVLEGAPGRAFAERLAQGSRVHVRVSGASGDIDLPFSAMGAGEAVKRVTYKCNDKRMIERLSDIGLVAGDSGL